MEREQAEKLINQFEQTYAALQVADFHIDARVEYQVAKKRLLDAMTLATEDCIDCGRAVKHLDLLEHVERDDHLQCMDCYNKECGLDDEETSAIIENNHDKYCFCSQPGSVGCQWK